MPLPVRGILVLGLSQMTDPVFTGVAFALRLGLEPFADHIGLLP